MHPREQPADREGVGHRGGGEVEAGAAVEFRWGRAVARPVALAVGDEVEAAGTAYSESGIGP